MYVLFHYTQQKNLILARDPCTLFPLDFPVIRGTWCVISVPRETIVESGPIAKIYESRRAIGFRYSWCVVRGAWLMIRDPWAWVTMRFNCFT